MTTNKYRRNSNSLFTAKRNYFLTGGPFNPLEISMPDSKDVKLGSPYNYMGEDIPDITEDQANPSWLTQYWDKTRSYFKNNPGSLNGLGAAAGNFASTIIGGDLKGTTTAGGIISGLSSVASAIPGPWGAIASAGLGVIGGLTDRAFGSKLNEANIQSTENNIEQLNSTKSNAGGYNSLMNNMLSAQQYSRVDQDYIGKDGWFSDKAKNKAAELNSQLATATDRQQKTFIENANQIKRNQLSMLESSYFDKGGTLSTNGGNFPMYGNFKTINNGGTHESNPFEGIPMGIDSEGTPNLVEEGETIYKDYVFSNRLTVPKSLSEKYGIKRKKEYTFADFSKKVAKEAEERPNDPISANGIEAVMSELMMAQEQLKMKEQQQQFALGGKLFATGGDTDDTSSQSLKYNKIIKEGDDLYNLYKNYLDSNNAIDFDKLYDANSAWKKRRDQLYDLLGGQPEKSREFRNWYAQQLNTYNSGHEGYKQVTGDDITQDIFGKWTSDRKGGAAHNIIFDSGIDRFLPSTPISSSKPDIPDDWLRYRYWLRTPNGKAELLSDYFPGVNLDGYTYEQQHGLKRAKDAWEIVRDQDSNGITYVDSYLDKVTPTKTEQEVAAKVDLDPQKLKELPTWMRYTPAVGLGLAAITDAAGITNKPDYSNANAILEASRNGGYDRIGFNPIGNYLEYKPFDRNYYTNQLNAQSGANRRALLQTAGLNRGAGISALLAADNNTQNQLGNLFRQSEEYNLAQREKVENFNRATNMTNSQGFLYADRANQAARQADRQFNLSGVSTAAELREKAKLASDAAKSANLSGLFTSIGDIGRENMAWNWRNYGIATDTFGVTRRDYDNLLGYLNWLSDEKSNNSITSDNSKANGGKLKKKRKGLTF